MKFAVGDRVVLLDCELTNQDNSIFLVGMTGEIIHVDSLIRYPYRVKWDVGEEVPVKENEICLESEFFPEEETPVKEISMDDVMSMFI